MKILSLFLVLAMLLSFAACGADTQNPDDSGAGDTTPADTAPAETTADPLDDNLPAETYDGQTVIVWVDGKTHFYGTNDETAYVEGEVMDDATRDRINTVRDRFDITFDFNLDYTSDWRNIADLRQSILGGDPYDITEGPSLNLCPLSVYGCFVDLADNEYINLEKPWYMPYATDALKIGSRQFRVAGFYDFATISRATVVYFNANVVEANNFGNLYDLVNAGDWTFDKMNEMCEIVAKDVNQDGVYDENDNYGCFARWDFMMSQENTTGYQYTKVEEDGSIKVTGLTEDLLEIHSKIYPFTTGSKMYWSGYTRYVHPSYTAAAPADNAKKAMFCNDQMLFMLESIGLTASQQMREFGAYGILPSPKYLENQETYGCATTCFCSAVCVTTADADETSIILEALQAESYKQVRPVYFDTALSYKYLNDPKAKEMLDLALSNVSCEFMYNYSMAGITNLQPALSSEANISSYFATNTPVVEEQLKQFMEQVDAIPE